MATVPSIDFSLFSSNVPGERQRVIAEIDEALQNIGFLSLSGHGIDQRKIDACFNWSRRLFAFSEDERNALPAAGLDNHGFSGLGMEKVRDLVPMNENFSFGNPEGGKLRNTWPPEEISRGFRDSMEDFYKDCARLIHQLLDCLSLALDLPIHDSLRQQHAESLFNMSLIHYPAIPANLAQSYLHARIPAHSDFGTLTLLFQDDVGGLEVADPCSTSKVTTVGMEKAGKFIHVDPVPGAVVVNVGYLLMRWSNGRWKNTVHRVSMPPGFNNDLDSSDATWEEDHVNAGSVPERYSIGCFASPDLEATVEAFPCCCREIPSRWKSINAGQFLQRKRASIFGQDTPVDGA